MSKKKNIKDMLETHLDKIVLGFIGVVSLYLLWAFVAGNPYGVQTFGRKTGPGRIDLQNRQEALVLEQLLDEPAERTEYDLQLAADFEDMLRTSLPQIAVHVPIPYPGTGEQVIDDDRVYPVPEVTALTEVQVALLRGAVFVPTAEVTPETPYQSVSSELGDLDLVTVSGRIDIPTLYRNFQQSFMGPRLNATWREPTYARPVVARMELQRRQKLADGTWGDWAVLPRTRIDPFRKLMEQTPMTTEEMEFGGVILWLKQYEDARVQVNLLQPEAYDFASVQTGWLPPKYLDESQTILKRQEDELRRQLREERLRARETGGPEGTPVTRQPARQPQTRPQPRGQRDTMPEPTILRTPAAAARRERTLDDVLRDMQQDRINDQTKLESRRDPLLVWAHDDTAQPGETYQYRIRLGVFNPIAGRNWFREDQEHIKNQVVLWSDYSGPTREVAIPKMMHIFPMDVLARDTGGGVKVDVARYFQGQWHTHEFEVYPGQVIGQSVEHTPPAAATPTLPAAAPTRGRGVMPMPEAVLMADPFAGGMGTTASAPRTVDFTTPYMLVDINNRIEWVSNFSNRSDYWQMLYYGSEETMLAMPVGRSNWPVEMRRERDEIKDAEQNAVPLNLTRSSTPGIMPREFGSPTAPMMPPPIFMPSEGL